MMPSTTPQVPYKPPGSDFYTWVDLNTRLLRDRVIFVGRFLDEEAANQIIATLLYLRSEDSTRPISLYMNVPGALMKPSLAIYDAMIGVECPISTLNLGLATGMGAFLCAAGTPGQRFCLPNARFLMQKTGMEEGMRGQATDLAIDVAENYKDNERMLAKLAQHTGQSLTKIKKDFERDFYLTANEAKLYGVVDKVLLPKYSRSDPAMRAEFGRFEGEPQRYQDYRESSGWGGAPSYTKG
ncbi:unnamed protein product [Vitrella brassicaformis CCMP3155]|uniref:ATP-dependent Clp protease proteolytic subunit n=2 Tax=Vitrella brassicaformis TaxID=1169539 RepID=A0A0G4ERW5_VITBC|nr:unnamed protein product [Vitrella brassicaformis CCMP3155]|eukprot:CEM00799.1 unnamed protein product [Vitrella brassicaformis CCMP3155]